LQNGVEIIWTKRAVKTFDKRIAYLEEIGQKKRYSTLLPL
jgi:hypothetical protein